MARRQPADHAGPTRGLGAHHGTIDRHRAALRQAQIDQELADPIILRQYLDFIRSATIAYYNWVAAGQRLALAEEILRIAKDRDSAIAEQVKKGASDPIVQIDNQRLVFSREIATVHALRRFQAAAIEQSLFFRTQDKAEPIIAKRDLVPKPSRRIHDSMKLSSLPNEIREYARCTAGAREPDLWPLVWG